METVGKWDGKIFQHGALLVQSEGPEEGGICEYGSLLSVSVDCGDAPVESPPNHLWLICGGVSPGLILGRNHN